MLPARNSLKQGDALSPLLFNFALEYAIGRVQINRDGMKLNGTHQLLVNADDVNILDRSMHDIKKNTEVLIVASKENGLEVMLIKLSTLSCLKIRMQEIIVSLKGWSNSNIWEQP
jgi:hypothetical protein